MAGKRFVIPGIFRNALILFSGSSLAQLIALGISPILSRIYNPDDFGMLALFLGLTGFFSIMATLRYELAIMLPSDNREASAIAKLSICIAIAIALFSALIIFFFGRSLSNALGNADLYQWLWLLPLMVFLSGLYQTLNYWSSRSIAFKRVAGARIMQSAVTGGTQMGLISLKGGGLIAGHVLGIAAGVGSLFLKTPAHERLQCWRATSSEMKLLARKYRDFPRFNGIQALVDSLQSSGLVFLISAFFGSVILGLYAFTFRILQAPLGLIGSSIAQAFYQNAAEEYNKGNGIQKLFTSALRSLLLFALPVFSIAILFAPTLFEFVFGDQWREAGVYAQYLAPWLFMNFLVSPFSQLPMIVGKQKQMLWFSLTGNLLILLSILAGALLFDDLKTGFCILSAGQVIYLSIVLYWFYGISSLQRKTDNNAQTNPD